MFQNDDLQWYPTPPKLGRQAWAKFKNRNFIRVLEPSAGDGALIKAHPHWDQRGYYRMPPVDAIEMDLTKHDAIRSCGADVVGLDFMSFGNGAMYSHVILNPPFKYGAQHVLKAWEILWDGELVAIINAETLRNPFSKERQMLARLIQLYGEVEFIQDAFQGSDVVREAEVEIALVYLKKEANLDVDIFGDMFDGLAHDGETGEGLAGQFRQMFEVALPNSLIENRVATFNAAVRAMQGAVFAEAKAMHYASLLGKTMAEHIDQKGAKASNVETLTYVKTTIAERYGKLKDSSWAGILRSSNVTSKLSSKAQRRVESEFERIKKLEFTCQTIYGFLLGLVESQGQIQIDMACDVFDAISQHHSDNTVWYKGWKSNDKHRTCGRKIKLSRFVIPRNRTWCDSLDWDSMQMLRDFDKVFAMLDGQAAPEVSLESLFTNHLRELRRGERLSGSYFDARFYPGAGTIHFFPNKKKNLVDRLNRLVGRHRQWLPDQDKGVSENFWLAYDKAEKLDAEVHKATAKSSRPGFWNSPFHSMFCRDGEERARAEAQVVDAIESVLVANGISPHFQAIEHAAPQKPLLLAA